MKRQTVLDLECPNRLGKRKCCGELQAEILSQRKGEILDGFLVCKRCRIKFPVIQSIPILVSDLKQYLKNNFRAIKKTVGGPDKIHKKLYLHILASALSVFKKKEDATLFGPGHTVNDGSSYFLLHYGDFYNTTHTPLMEVPLKLHKKNNAYEIFKKHLAKINLKDKKALDVGCNVGGLTHLLAKSCSFSYGVDIEYENIFKASKVIKHLPAKLNEYKVNEGGKLRTKKIRIKNAGNIDFVLASADNLPFKDRTFAISLSSSVLDITGNNLKILKEAYRTLAKEGKIFLSFVPFFKMLENGRKKFDLTAENIKKYSKNIRFYKEYKNIPFILRRSENFYSVYANCCMIGRRVR